MTLFFDSLSAMHAFSLHPLLACPHCGLDDQLVSHGYVYQKQLLGAPVKQGKRVLCSDRARRSGCGRTVRLYLAPSIPRYHYSAAVLTAFLLALLQGTAVAPAYQQVTHCHEPRQAWRWLQRLSAQLPAWRSRLSLQHHPAFRPRRSGRLSVLLPTFCALQSLSRTSDFTTAAVLQLSWQSPFC